MTNKELAQYLQYQIDKKKRMISNNNTDNVDLRMDCQHLESAIKIINDAVVAKAEQEDKE